MPQWNRYKDRGKTVATIGWMQFLLVYSLAAVVVHDRPLLTSFFGDL
jgi:hypothetical protein